MGGGLQGNLPVHPSLPGGLPGPDPAQQGREANRLHHRRDRHPVDADPGRGDARRADLSHPALVPLGHIGSGPGRVPPGPDLAGPDRKADLPGLRHVQPLLLPPRPLRGGGRVRDGLFVRGGGPRVSPPDQGLHRRGVLRLGQRGRDGGHGLSPLLDDPPPDGPGVWGGLLRPGQAGRPAGLGGDVRDHPRRGAQGDRPGRTGPDPDAHPFRLPPVRRRGRLAPRVRLRGDALHGPPLATRARSEPTPSSTGPPPGRCRSWPRGCKAG